MYKLYGHNNISTNGKECSKNDSNSYIDFNFNEKYPTSNILGIDIKN